MNLDPKPASPRREAAASAAGDAAPLSARLALPRSASLRARMLIAVAAPAVALGLSLAMRPWLASRPFALFFGAVFVAAWYGGWLAGLLSAAASFLVLHLFLLEPFGRFEIASAADAVQNATFLSIALLASWLSGSLRDAHGRAVESAEENALLAMRLQEQAVELEQQAEEAQALTVELEDQVEEAARLRGELENSNERLTAILETLTEGVVLAAPDGSLTFANASARTLLERLPDGGALGFDGAAFDLGRQTPLGRALQAGQPVTGAELAIAENGGRPTVLRVNAAPLHEPGARVAGVVASFYDVTAEREAQNAVQESEARFRTMADTAPVLIWTAGTDALCNFFNRGWLEFTGRSVEQELGNGWTEGVHPDDYARCMEVYLENFHARRPFVMEYRLRRADGEYRWLLDHGVPRFEPDGSFAGFIGSCIDINERRENEEGLRFLSQAGAVLASSLDYEETLKRVCRLAVPTIADFCVVDLLDDGAIRRVEAAHADPAMAPVMEELLRHPPAMDHPEHPVPRVLRSGETLVSNVIRESMADGTPEHAQSVRRLSPTAFVVVPLRAGTQVLGALTLLTTSSGRRFDPADVRRAEELGVRAGYAIENARLYQRTAEASRAKSDFMAVMSHELRTPLNAILGYTDLFLTGIPEPLPGSMVPQVERVQQAARHLRDLIEEVLSFARIESGHEEVQVADADAAELAREVAALAEPLALERRLAFRLELPPAPVPLRTDARKVRQILLNLVANGIKFTDQGEVVVGVEDGGGEVRMRVRDTGPGIAAQHLERIFEPFWQADQGLAREHGGSGLGLAVARQLARLLGGDVTVQSEPGAGSVFTLRLPGTGPHPGPHPLA